MSFKFLEKFIDFSDKTPSTPAASPAKKLETITSIPPTPYAPGVFAVNQELYTEIKKSVDDRSPGLYKELVNCLSGLASITTISIVQKYQAAFSTLLSLKKEITPSAVVNAVAGRLAILESIKAEVAADFANDSKKIEGMTSEIEKTTRMMAELQLKRDELTAKVAAATQQLQKNESDFKLAADQLLQELTNEHQLIQGIKIA